ncbi:TonB-dependent receptor domain-containing protein [Sphingomonas sp. HT-1]|uniref:TonB-dependent receptor domain-containing protein n=1 Tax=unclassified Sphingomonas TaxID=196159 RepID=UPI0003114049|nr:MULTISPECIES: TonB-dependent receptor [unclassified Sphingomonas]KTF70376.1 TonB-dependent receptor [Sphingomonas sp. WG]
MKNMQVKLRGGIALSAFVLAGVLTASPALAQDTVPQTDDAAQGSQEIVVTGSRIPQPNLTSTAPVTVVSSEDIKAQGTTRVEDLLNSLPSVAASQASSLANGATGTATVDLRGLGTARTLTLVNGRRLMPGTPGPGGGSAADINIIPAAMVKRVEVLTGGASSTYGADAVAGVVNFILDTDFEGFRIDGQYSVYQHGNRNKVTPPLLDARTAAGQSGFDYPTGSVVDGGAFDGTVAFGTKLGDGGHAMAYFGYRKVNAVTQARRDYSACTIQNTGAGRPQCGGSLTSGNGTAILFDPRLNTSSSTVYTFMPNGGFENTTTRFNFAPTNYFQRPDERFTAGAFINYEVADSFKPYLEFMFMDDRTVAQIAPSGDFGNTLTVNCDNPLLSAAQRSVICASGNLINGFLGDFPLAAAAPYNPNPSAPALTFFDPRTGTPYNRAFMQLLRRNTEGGPRQADLQHTNFRGVIGAKGDLSPVWSYDASYQYGRVNYSQTYLNEFSVARLTRALDVVDDPRVAGINPICRSVLDGSDAACVPYNVFAGPGQASAESVAYLSATGFQRGNTTEQVANVSFTGDLGQYGARLPWATDGIGVNLGVEWRRSSLDLQTDSAFQAGDLTGQGGRTLPISGNFRVYEFFGETQIPIVQNGFIESLAINAGYRRSSYKTSRDNKFDTDTYKVGVEFAPVSDIRLRGTYNRAVRAPNLQELFSTATVGLNGSVDPCADIGPITATNYGCRAQGIAVGQGVTGNPAGQYNGLIGGNPNLQPEVATTKTAGLVFQPSFLRSLAVTVDYFDIKIKNAIRAFGQDAILQDCATATATFTPASCALVRRDAAGSLWLTPGGYVSDLPNNVGELQTKGIEVGASYAVGLGSLGRLSFNMQGTYLDSYRVNNGLSKPYDCAGYYGSTCSIGGTTNAGAPLPKWRHKLRASWQVNQSVGISAQWRYIGAIHSQATSPDEALKGAFVFDPGSRLKPYNYIDLMSSFQIGKSYTFRLGVNNLFDLEPPLVTSGNAGRAGSNQCPTGPCNGNTYPATYDALGRYLFAGVTLNF